MSAASTVDPERLRDDLIGEHTDYNDGRAELTLADSGATGTLDVTDPGARRGTWLD